MYLAACERRAEESAAPPSNHLVRRHPRGATDRARIKVGTASRCEGRRLTTLRTLGTVHALTGPCAMNGRVLKRRRLSIDTSGLGPGRAEGSAVSFFTRRRSSRTSRWSSDAVRFVTSTLTTTVAAVPSPPGPSTEGHQDCGNAHVPG